MPARAVPITPRCATCRAPHMTMVARGFYGGRAAYMVIDTREVFDADTGLPMTVVQRTSDFRARRVLRIMLACTKVEGAGDVHYCQLHSRRNRPRISDGSDEAKEKAARTRRAKSPQMDMEDLL